MKGGKKVVNKSKGYKIAGAIVGAILLIILIQVFFYGGENVNRSFSDSKVGPGESFDVTLDIRLDSDQTYYLLEETIPEGFVTENENAKGNKIRLIEIQGAESTVFTYTVKAPMEPGTYEFYGQYGVALVKGTRDIGGASTVIVG